MDGGGTEAREEGSDDTEVMETEPPGEPYRGKSARAVETAEDVDVPEEPEAWDSGQREATTWSSNPTRRPRKRGQTQETKRD